MDSGEFWLGAILLVIGLVVAFYVAWIALAVALRLFALLLVGLIISATLGAIAGVALGVWIPVAVLTGRSQRSPRLLTPTDVKAGTVFRGKPSGPAEHFGWDEAWPTYLPFQARRDARAVLAETGAWIVRSARWLFIEDLDEPAVLALKIVIFGPAFLFAVPGLVLSIAVWCVVMAVLGGILTLLRQCVLGVHRLQDRATLRRRRASLECLSCFHVTQVPTFGCTGTGCTIDHHDIRPGPLGVIARRCGCGEALATTVNRAARTMEAKCPRCSAPQPLGSGTRLAVPVPVIGEVSAGKTRFLAASIVGLDGAVTRIGGTVKPLTTEARQQLAQYHQLISSQRNTTKTPEARGAGGVSLLVDLPGERDVELHLFDPAGEHFATWETTSNLRYLDRAKAMLLLVDPLSIPDVRRELRRVGLASAVAVAPGDTEQAYASAIDRLRQESVKLQNRQLGVVLTKADVLAELPSATSLTTGGSDEIRAWLLALGQDLLVERFERDFGTVRYFLSDAMSPPQPRGNAQALGPLLWTMKVAGMRSARVIDDPLEVVAV